MKKNFRNSEKHKEEHKSVLHLTFYILFYFMYNVVCILLGFPGGSVRIHLPSRCGFSPWGRKIPWRRKWQPTPVFLPGKSHGQRSLADYSPWGHKRVRHHWATKHSTNKIQRIKSIPPHAQKPLDILNITYFSLLSHLLFACALFHSF